MQGKRSMDYTTLTPPTVNMEENPLTNSALMHSLYTTLQQVSDPRRKQGTRYEAALVLCVLVLAKLAGQQSLSGATEWIRLRGTHIAHHFGLHRQDMPCQMTYCRLLARLDLNQVDELLRDFFIRWEASLRCGTEPSRLKTAAHGRSHQHLALDGKMLRATTGQTHPTHLLSCYDVTTGTVLWQCNVGEKQNEISALKPLLTPELVKGRILSLDAMHTQRELCANVHRWGGAYLLVAKDNQPTLREDIADLFEDPQADRRRWKEASTWNKGHGRLEYRQITCSPDLNDWFGKDWAGIAQVFRLQRCFRTLKTGTLHQEVVYGLSSLPMRQTSASRLLQLIRDHWKIENRLHWRRDVTLGEDQCQTRSGPVPQALARLNCAVLSIMDCLGVRNVARQARFFDAHPEQALQLLTLGCCPVY